MYNSSSTAVVCTPQRRRERHAPSIVPKHQTPLFVFEAPNASFRFRYRFRNEGKKERQEEGSRLSTVDEAVPDVPTPRGVYLIICNTTGVVHHALSAGTLFLPDMYCCCITAVCNTDVLLYIYAYTYQECISTYSMYIGTAAIIDQASSSSRSTASVSF